MGRIAALALGVAAALSDLGNVHPSFFLGFLILAIAALTGARRGDWNGAIVLVLCSIATLGTPIGARLWPAIFGMSGWSIRNVSEWQSTLVAAPGLMLLFLLPALAVAAGGKVRKRPNLAGRCGRRRRWRRSRHCASCRSRSASDCPPDRACSGSQTCRSKLRARGWARSWWSRSRRCKFGPDVAAAIRAPVADADFGLLLAGDDPIETAARYPVAGKLTYCYPVRYCNVVLLHGGRTLLDGRTLPFPEDRMPSFDASIHDFSAVRWPFTLAMVAPQDDSLHGRPGWRLTESAPHLRIYERPATP